MGPNRHLIHRLWLVYPDLTKLWRRKNRFQKDLSKGTVVKKELF